MGSQLDLKAARAENPFLFPDCRCEVINRHFLPWRMSSWNGSLPYFSNTYRPPSVAAITRFIRMNISS